MIHWMKGWGTSEEGRNDGCVVDDGRKEHARERRKGEREKDKRREGSITTQQLTLVIYTSITGNGHSYLQRSDTQSPRSTAYISSDKETGESAARAGMLAASK